MRFETTTQRPVEVSGVGLHSGVEVSVRITPAAAGAGIVFVRTDLDRFPIPASWKYVARVSYATSLMRQGVLISTTEHILSVFYAMGIDNAVVEINSLEAPILDGSGWPFVELLEQAGRRQLAGNLRRAAELVSVPDDFLLQVYNALRPRRSTAPELAALAARLCDEFHAPACARWVQEAAAVYARYGLLRS